MSKLYREEKSFLNNVVINGTAKKIVLTDAMPFEAPTAFHADAISYTRTIEESLTTVG